MFLSLNSQVLPLSAVDEYAETLIAQRISMVDGVSQVQVYGAQKYAVRVQIDPARLANRGIGIDQVNAAITNGNPNTPVGTLYGKTTNLTLADQRSTAERSRVSAADRCLSQWSSGALAGRRHCDRRRRKQQGGQLVQWPAQRDDGRAAPAGNQHRRRGRRHQERSCLSFAQQLPASVNLDVLNDRSISIRQSVDDVQFSLLLAIALVVLVIFLFLRNIRATIIPTLALPTSIVGTFAAMYLLHFSLDNLSLMALTLSVGFVVDDAVVMLENIVRRIEQGETVMEAASARFTRNRLHDRLDDCVAGRRLYSRALSWVAFWAGCFANSPSPSAWPFWCRVSSR